MEQPAYGVVEVMSVYFNELTLDESAAQNVRLLRSFRKVWARFCEESKGIGKRILVDEKTLARLSNALYNGELRGDPELMQFVATVLNRPYCTTDKTWPEEIRDHFLGSEFSINISPRRTEECRTLGWAYLNDSVTLGFESSHFWSSLVHRITESSLEGGDRRIDVLCVTKESHVKDAELQTWLVCQRDFEKVSLPSPCKLDPSRKKIHYRDDHGREILDAFANRLVQNEYVEGIVNSLPWQSHCDHFILGQRPDGIVNVCLHWHDEGYGLAVQTTARGIPQTMLVADLLERQFDQRT